MFEGLADEFITRAEAAELAGVDTRTIDRWANEGKIIRHKVTGRQWVRFRRAEIEAMTRVEPVDVAGPVTDVVSLEADPFAGE
jgi:excisionase family DNA binding protein